MGASVSYALRFLTGHWEAVEKRCPGHLGLAGLRVPAWLWPGLLSSSAIVAASRIFREGLALFPEVTKAGLTHSARPRRSKFLKSALLVAGQACPRYPCLLLSALIIFSFVPFLVGGNFKG